jgi:hypothetical protein
MTPSPPSNVMHGVHDLGRVERFPTIFKVSDGMLGTAALDGSGLGY